MLHSTRFKIAETIYNDYLYANEITKKIGVDRRLICFYLMDLDRMELIDHEFRVITPPDETWKSRAGKFCKLNEEGQRIFDAVKCMIDKIGKGEIT